MLTVPVTDVFGGFLAEAFSALLVTGATCFAIGFLIKRQFLEIFVFLVPLFFVVAVHQDMFWQLPDHPWIHNLIVSLSGLSAALLTNFCWWLAIRQVRRSDSRKPVVIQHRLLILAYYCSLLFLNYGYIFEVLGLKESDGSITHNVFTALYFTAMTSTTVGYGDVTPHDSFSRFFAALAAFNGYAVLAVLVAALLPHFMSSADAKQTSDAEE